MIWTETTDKNNPLSCNKEYCLDVPWLNHTTNGGIAYYSVRKELNGTWESMFWHGNRGHKVKENAISEMQAKVFCQEHMKEMFFRFSIEIGKLLGTYYELV